LRCVRTASRLVSAAEATTSQAAVVRKEVVGMKPLEGPLVGSVRTVGSPRWFSGSGAQTGSKQARLHLEQKSREARRKAVENASYLTAIVIGMVGLTYASVPLYRMFCQATGYGGTTQRALTLEEKLAREDAEEDLSASAAAAERSLTVHFNADITSGMHWKFTPTQKKVRTTPGESTLAFYTVKNLSDKAVTGVSTYNVTPQKAGVYFNKIQCFCFEEQRLRPNEEIDMPVFFYIDREFATDPNMSDVTSLTLSYTFFKVSEEDGDEEE